MSEDALWSAYGAEDERVKAGFEEGVRHGEKVGIQDGWELGIQKGYEMGVEIGFYKGSLRILRSAADRGLTTFPDRAAKGMVNLEELLRNVPLDNPQDEGLHDAMDKVRGAFKALVAGMGLTKTFFPVHGPPSYSF